MSITHSVCAFVALGIQHPKRMHYIIICVLPKLNKIFPHYLTKGKIFDKTLYKKKNARFEFPSKFVSNTRRWNGGDVIKNVWWSSSSLFVFHLNENWIFLDRYSKSSQISNFMNICTVQAEFYTFGRTDRRFSHFLIKRNNKFRGKLRYVFIVSPETSTHSVGKM
jgi:hypothetical protein